MMRFKSIDFSMKPRIDAIIARWGEGSCQHSFVTLYSLQEKYGDTVCLDGDTLFVCREHLSVGDYRVCLMPLGPEDVRDTVGRLLEDTHGREQKLRLFPVTERAAQAVEQAFPGRFRITPDRDWAEYLYDSRKLVELPGSELAGKRRSIRLFYRDLPGEVQVLPLTPELVERVEAFHELWLVDNQMTHDAAALERELRFVHRQLSVIPELGITGFVVTVGGEIRGYCYGVPITEQVYDAIIMKGDRNIHHIYAFMYQELGKLGSCCKYVNFEEDLGIAGLRECKLSYRPDIMLYKFCVEEL